MLTNKPFKMINRNLKFSLFFLFILFMLTLGVLSCNKIKSKGKEIASKIKEEVKDKSNDLLDKAFPHFDYDTADTKYNKQRFEEYLEVKLTSDVKEIYCYGDFLGADYKVLFSFKCDSTTIQRIIKKKNLKPVQDINENGFGFTVDFKWWDIEKMKRLRPYKVGVENKFWQYLWFDKEVETAFYEEYSL